MNLPVLYTSRAQETFESTNNFIAGKFGINAANKFIAKTDKVASLISGQPLMYKSSAIDESVRIAFITKQTSLFL